MSSLTELADFLIHYANSRAELSRAAWGFLYGEGSPMQQGAVNNHLMTERAVEMVLHDTYVLPTDAEKHAVLYGLAERIGATEAEGFDPSWRP